MTINRSSIHIGKQYIMNMCTIRDIVGNANKNFQSTQRKNKLEKKREIKLSLVFPFSTVNLTHHFNFCIIKRPTIFFTVESFLSIFFCRQMFVFFTFHPPLFSFFFSFLFGISGSNGFSSAKTNLNQRVFAYSRPLERRDGLVKALGVQDLLLVADCGRIWVRSESEIRQKFQLITATTPLLHHLVPVGLFLAVSIQGRAHPLSK